MNWIPLETEQQVEEIKAGSFRSPQVIFKHSIRCGTSSMAKNRLEREETPEGVDFYFLDVIRHRRVSDKVAAAFGIRHESPQILIIENGICRYNESHYAIDMSGIKGNVTRV
ncbi:MAG TPA: bacillithiol system redox-active protein YtxJ [Chitinophagaceae bacterium]|nr:bacillithiol system redox-active protein YtxJ [Chitinophagaceae bacterium]